MENTQSKQRLICTHPFEWCEVHPDGRTFLCCPAWLKTPLGNLLDTPLAELWNGPVAQQIRLGIHRSSFERCNRKRCPRLATTTAPVQRLDQVTDPLLREALDQKWRTLPFGPRILNLCIDPRCNLACPSCRSSHLTLNQSTVERVERLLARIRQETGASLREIRMSGYGDPLASPSLRRWLQNFDHDEFPSLERIHLHSNGLLFDAALWSSFAPVQSLIRSCEISIDAASDATYRANRGGDFAQLLERLAFIATLPMERTLSFVVQENNLAEMEAFVTLAEGSDAAVYFSQLVNWGTFSREEFARRAVQVPEHPRHGELLAILKRLNRRPRVDLGNLTPRLQTQNQPAEA